MPEADKRFESFVREYEESCTEEERDDLDTARRAARESLGDDDATAGVRA